MLGAVVFALAALLAKLCLCRKTLIRQKPFFLVGVGQVPCHGEVLFEMFVGAEARDRCRNEIVVQHPLQQSRLAGRRQLLRQLRVGLTVPPACVFMATIPIPLFAARSIVLKTPASCAIV